MSSASLGKTDVTAKNPFSITRIRVDRLFGRYTYDLAVSGPLLDFSKLIILYGDNGSGKTTLLKAIFHLLSPAGNKNHRRSLGRTKFKKLSVELANGTVISAERLEEPLEGTFQMSVEAPGVPTVSSSFDIDPNSGKILPEKKTRTRGLILAKLKELNVKIHFLSDDRKIITDMIPSEEEPEDAEPSLGASRVYRYFIDDSTASSKADTSIDVAIKRAHEWVKNQAIAGSGAGDTTTNTLYADIANRIVRSPVKGSTDRPNLQNLIADFEKQALRSLAFSRFGLAPELLVEDLVAVLRSQSAADRADILSQILQPFLNGIRIKLDALDTLRTRVSTFIDLLNAFYKNKNVGFNLKEGLAIRTDDDELLKPALLSSGEKQLLLLFCNVLSSSEDSTIFIIDEPELSLNIKWQRQLVNALLDCTSGYQIQFILATHSLELLTQHRENVIRLESVQ